MSPNARSTKLSNVPDSSPGPVMTSSPSGKVVLEPSSVASACASDQFANPVDSGPISAYRSANDRQVTAVLLTELSTDRPSMATLSSTYSMPAPSHSATSSSEIAREASAMSASPAQNFWNPSPVPGPSTVNWKSGFASLKASATPDEMGSTVDDPVTKTGPPPAAMLSAGALSAGVDAAGSAGVDAAGLAPPPPPQAANRAAASVEAADPLRGGELHWGSSW